MDDAGATITHQMRSQSRDQSGITIAMDLIRDLDPQKGNWYTWTCRDQEGMSDLESISPSAILVIQGAFLWTRDRPAFPLT